ncbi:MAG: GTPase [Candidatus Helarchaeota archaeon]
MTDKFTRIVWNVIRESDIIVEVLDARDPLGTRSKKLESFVQRFDDKKLVLLINKVDLVPKYIINKWVELFSKEFPTFYMSNKRGFKKYITFFKNQLLKMIDIRPIRVSLVGYPNVGKSSIINAIRKKKVAPTSPLAGFTRGKKYISVFSGEILLIDTPGVIPYLKEDEVELIIKGAIRPDKITDLFKAVDELLLIIDKKEIRRKYDIIYDSSEDFLNKLALKRGKLLAGGKPDINAAAKIFINEFQRGKINYYIRPPNLQ